MSGTYQACYTTQTHREHLLDGSDRGRITFPPQTNFRVHPGPDRERVLPEGLCALVLFRSRAGVVTACAQQGFDVPAAHKAGVHGYHTDETDTSVPIKCLRDHTSGRTSVSPRLGEGTSQTAPNGCFHEQQSKTEAALITALPDLKDHRRSKKADRRACDQQSPTPQTVHSTRERGTELEPFQNYMVRLSTTPMPSPSSHTLFTIPVGDNLYLPTSTLRRLRNTEGHICSHERYGASSGGRDMPEVKGRKRRSMWMKPERMEKLN
ncbi:unnamed protein product [Pleuronectes platessa]|uniref:Uncharacterized protein n=1 Tax=Pleuronectes platessa TaxID=8262 RepID=A0A9N7VLM8_PLEPL|nr:unnamed protein product [Pleuronectes platessa]